MYLEDMEAGYGVRRIRKLKYKHIHLSSFSKMRGDLAAQVIVRLQCTDSLTIILQALGEQVELLVQMNIVK